MRGTTQEPLINRVALLSIQDEMIVAISIVAVRFLGQFRIPEVLVVVEAI